MTSFDVFSIENLIPPPPKPPKTSIKMASNNNKNSFPSMRSSSLHSNTTSDQVYRHKASSSEQNVLVTSSSPQQQEPPKQCQKQVLLNKTRNKTITRLQSSPLPLQSSPSQFGHSIRSLPSSIERASFCAVNLNRCSSELEMQAFESATSGSLIHGIILIAIMLSSLAAFVCSKLKDACEDYYLAPNYDCSQFFSVFFSIINIFSCLYAFTIYFLHLIGQCDYLTLSARRNVTIEILCTFMVIFILIASDLLFLTQTMAIHIPITIIGSIFTFLAIFFYFVRTFLLIREIKMLWSQQKPHIPLSPTNTVIKEPISPQDSFHRRSTAKSSKESESGSIRASVPVPVSFSHQTRPKQFDDGGNNRVTFY